MPGWLVLERRDRYDADTNSVRVHLSVVPAGEDTDPTTVAPLQLVLAEDAVLNVKAGDTVEITVRKTGSRPAAAPAGG